jgi:hypothetical protein
MKAGDLVIVGPRKTRKGLPYDDKVGTVLSNPVVRLSSSTGFKLEEVTVMFAGEKYVFDIKDLEIVNE